MSTDKIYSSAAVSLGLDEPSDDTSGRWVRIQQQPPYPRLELGQIERHPGFVTYSPGVRGAPCHGVFNCDFCHVLGRAWCTGGGVAESGPKIEGN